MYIEYEVDLGSNIWKKGRKTHILGKFRGGCTGTEQSCIGPVVFCFPFLTSVRILDKNFSFLIRFE